MPGWLYRSDPSDRLFADELIDTIAASGRYRALPLDLPSLSFSTPEEAGKFCLDNDLALILEHDSPLYSKSPRYAKNVGFLEAHVPFLNPSEVHKICNDKVGVKRTLQTLGIPVLEDAVVRSLEDLRAYMQEDALYVIKPLNKGGGTGVKLIKRTGNKFFEHAHQVWKEISILETNKRLIVRPRLYTKPFIALFGVLSAFALAIAFPSLLILAAITGMASVYLLTERSDDRFLYDPILVEPFFNNGGEEFVSLRCTVIGDQVVEAVRRSNRKNVTSNVSRGGIASKTELTEQQKQMAIAAKNAVGATYAGVDLLICKGESVIGEVNVGPITIFSTTTGASVGRTLGEYAMAVCDKQNG